MKTAERILETASSQIYTKMDDYPGILSLLLSLVIIIVVVN